MLRDALKQDPSILREALEALEAADAQDRQGTSAPPSPPMRRRCSATRPIR